MLTLMFAGYRMEAIKIMGREVLQGRGLVGLGCDSIDYSGLEISQVHVRSEGRRSHAR